MTSLKFSILLIINIVVISTFAIAQEPNCENPQYQAEMNICAYRDFEAADLELNKVYKDVRQQLIEFDQDLPDYLRGGADALRDAQRAWITFRDKACEAEGFMVRGGTMEPLIISSCLARLTRQRTQDLNEAFRTY